MRDVGPRWVVWAVVAIAFVALAACKPNARSPQLQACQAGAPSKAALSERIKACTALIATARGEELKDALIARGEAHRRQGDDAAAIADFTQALAAAPNDETALNDRGLAYHHAGDLIRALADYDHAISAHPQSATGYNNRGAIERLQGRLGPAMHDANRAIALDPKTAYHWSNRGQVYLAEHRWELALADFVDALRINPFLVEAVDGAGMARFGKGDWANAGTTFNEAATDEFNAGRYPAAVTEVNKALAIWPDNAEALNNRCWIRAIANTDLPAALADCQRSLHVRPNDAATLDSQAFVHFRMGDFHAAIAGYDDALKADNSLAPSRFMRGICELRLGDREHGEADIAAAEQADRTVAAQFAAWGVTP